MDCSPSGSSVRGISQAKILEEVTVSFSKGSYQPRNQTRISCTAQFFTAEPVGKPQQMAEWQLKKEDTLIQIVFILKPFFSNRDILLLILYFRPPKLNKIKWQ